VRLVVKNFVQCSIVQNTNKKKCVAYPQEDFLISIYNFAWGLLKASNLQAEYKNLKKLLEHQIYQPKQKFLKKNGKRPKIYPDGICRPDPKS
jgi:hypothetical protein